MSAVTFMLFAVEFQQKNKLKKISLRKSIKESLLWVFSCSGAINIKEVSWRVGREDPSRIGGARVIEIENA